MNRLVETRDAVTFLLFRAGECSDENRPTVQQRRAAAAALFRWRKAGYLAAHRGGTRDGALWDWCEIQAALESHVERYGAPPWRNGRGPQKKDPPA